VRRIIPAGVNLRGSNGARPLQQNLLDVHRIVAVHLLLEHIDVEVDEVEEVLGGVPDSWAPGGP